MSRGARKGFAPARLVFAYAGTIALGDSARRTGLPRITAAAHALGAHLWQRLGAEPAPVPEAVFAPFRRELARAPAIVDAARGFLQERIAEAAPMLAAASAALAAGEGIAADVTEAARREIGALPAVPAWWAALQFEPRELGTLGLAGWALAILPRLDGPAWRVAAARAALAGAIANHARMPDDGGRLHPAVKRIDALLHELGKAVPAELWPAFDAGGEHHFAPVATRAAHHE